MYHQNSLAQVKAGSRRSAVVPELLALHQAVRLAPEPDLGEVAEIPAVGDDAVLARQRAGHKRGLNGRRDRRGHGGERPQHPAIRQSLDVRSMSEQGGREPDDIQHQSASQTHAAPRLTQASALTASSRASTAMTERTGLSPSPPKWFTTFTSPSSCPGLPLPRPSRTTLCRLPISNVWDSTRCSVSQMSAPHARCALEVYRCRNAGTVGHCAKQIDGAAVRPLRRWLRSTRPTCAGLIPDHCLVMVQITPDALV